MPPALVLVVCNTIRVQNRFVVYNILPEALDIVDGFSERKTIWMAFLVSAKRG